MKGQKLLLAGAFAALATAVIGGVNAYGTWKRKEVVRMEAESRVRETALGPIEYRTLGAGPAILIIHGSPGGYDQAMAFARLIARPHFTFIAVSRPGYLRTPLTAGATPEEQADLYAALLDALGIQQATVIGISGGGPSTLQFALRHAERCKRIVMISCVAQHYSEQELLDVLPPTNRFLRQIFVKLASIDLLLHLMLPLTLLVPDDHASLALLRSTTMFPLRKRGYENDMQQFAAITGYPLEKITQPTFVVHGMADVEVSFEDAKLLARTLPHVKLLAIAGGDHMVFYTHIATIRPQLHHFLEDGLQGTDRIDIDLPTGSINDA